MRWQVRLLQAPLTLRVLPQRTGVFLTDERLTQPRRPFSVYVVVTCVLFPRTQYVRVFFPGQEQTTLLLRVRLKQRQPRAYTVVYMSILRRVRRLHLPRLIG